MGKSRIKTISVEALHDRFDYTVTFRDSSSNIIIIAPNGYGKTAFLSVINTCLQFRLLEASRLIFRKLTVKFEDGTRLEFLRTKERSRRDDEFYKDETFRRHYPKLSRERMWIKATLFDAKGKSHTTDIAGKLLDIPQDLVMRALDRALPVVRHEYDVFRDMRSGDILSIEETIERYRDQLLNNSSFLSSLGTYAANFAGIGLERTDCVFIETQRLLYRNKAAKSPGDPPLPEEEVNRQASSLAELLQLTYSNYASVSQGLDRSFPNRLIARAAARQESDVSALRSELNAIEDKRKALTEAGILVETAEPLVPPKDEYLPTVAQALQIYVEDSRVKLSTYDDIFPKISTFREIIANKLRPKQLIIDREKGATLKRDNLPLNLEGLSSGEKHEFIMFFRLIFETKPESLVLIDEPEISLHVLWQLEFMPDLIQVQNANKFQSIIATHSPQIFQGFESDIVDLADQSQ